MRKLIKQKVDVEPAPKETRKIRLRSVSKQAKRNLETAGNTAGMQHTLQHVGGKKEMPTKVARQEQFLSIYRENLFNISDAARRIGIDRSTVYHWQMNDPNFKDRMNDVKEEVKDFVEHALFEKIKAGDIAAIIFASKCLCRDRGYAPDKLLTLDVRHADNRLNLTKEENDKIIEAAMVTPDSLSDSPAKSHLQEIITQQSQSA